MDFQSLAQYDALLARIPQVNDAPAVAILCARD
jgi:hypothetical protein